MSEATWVLRWAVRGEPKAAEELLPLVYEGLCKLAAARMADEKARQRLAGSTVTFDDSLGEYE